MLRALFTAAAIAAVGACLPVADAQTVTCDLKALCQTDRVNYDPAEKRGFVVFGNVGVIYDDYQVWKIVDDPGVDEDMVHVEIGGCRMNIYQPHTPLPTPEGDSQFRRKLARMMIDAALEDLTNTAAVMSTAGPELVRDEPGFAQYQVTSKWVGLTDTGTSTEVRRVTVGYYQAIEKWCKGADAEAAQKAYDAHRVIIRTGPDQ